MQNTERISSEYYEQSPLEAQNTIISIPDSIDGIEDDNKIQAKKRKLHSWIWHWGNYRAHPANKKIYFFDCNLYFNEGEKCEAKIELNGSTGNAISHLARKHHIYESTPRSTEPLSNDQTSSITSASWTNRRQQDCENLLFEWIVLDCQPLYILNSSSFHQFIHSLNEYFEIPNDKKLRKKIFEAFNYCKDFLIKYIHENAISVSLTCDLWTSRSKQGFLAVTCHFITAQFEMKEITLAICYVPYPHTANAIQQFLENIIYEWKLRDMVFFCTTDNGSNMKKCINQISWLSRLSCTAHTIQLVVGKGLLPAETLIARAKRVINFFSTPKQSQRLQKAQQNNSLDLIQKEGTQKENLHEVFYKAITDCETRWSSTFNAWHRLIILKPFIDICLTSMNASNDRETKQDAKKLEKINLIPEEWRCIEKFLEILSPFAELTEILEGHKYTTMSYIHPGITKLKKLVGSNVDTHDEDINFDNNDNAFEEHLFEEPEEEDESHAKRKIRINTPVDTKELINKVKKNLYQALENIMKLLILKR